MFPAGAVDRGWRGGARGYGEAGRAGVYEWAVSVLREEFGAVGGGEGGRGAGEAV